jgi:hypothetical protein
VIFPANQNLLPNGKKKYNNSKLVFVVELIRPSVVPKALIPLCHIPIFFFYIP